MRRFVARFSPLVRKNAPIARSSHGLSALNGSLYVIGGEAEARTPIDMAVHVLPALEEADAGEWRTIKAERAPPARIAHAQATVGDELVIFGGRAGVAASRFGWEPPPLLCWEPAQRQRVLYG